MIYSVATDGQDAFDLIMEAAARLLAERGRRGFDTCDLRSGWRRSADPLPTAVDYGWSNNDKISSDPGDSLVRCEVFAEIPVQ